MRESGGEKKKTSGVFAAARHSNRTRCTALAACVALVITAASAGDSTRPRVCACMCVRVSRTAVAQRRNIRAVLFTPRSSRVSSAMVKLDGHV